MNEPHKPLVGHSAMFEHPALSDPVPAPQLPARKAALDRQACLTKPTGALGDLEHIAIALAGHQGRVCPVVVNPEALIFAADHGVANQGVSAYPPSVTAQMVLNFLNGGAAISVLSHFHKMRLTVVDAGVHWALSGLATPPSQVRSATPGVVHSEVSAPVIEFVQAAVSSSGSACFTEQPALSVAALEHAFRIGREAVLASAARGCDVLLPGEMGIGNTSSATALACCMLHLPVAQVAGRGTGVDEAGYRHKCDVIASALLRHADALQSGHPLDALRCVGGLEIAALVSALITAAQQRITLLVDGFIVSVAALVACRLQPGVRDWMLFAHQSAEAGHNAVLSALDAKPLMNLGMRLGEGSGAAVALPLLKMACTLHADMATFAQAGVSDRDSPAAEGSTPQSAVPGQS